MVGGKMKNPLKKRYLRELKSELGKYLVIFIFVVGMVGILSAYLIAGDSIKAVVEQTFEENNVEDGHFQISSLATHDLIEILEKEELTVNENFYKDCNTEEVESTLRIYKNRENINKAFLMEGELPQSKDEIAIDRVYAQNNNYEVGDTITADETSYEVVGYIALPDYGALYENNGDMMYETIHFGVGITTEEGFLRVSDENLHYNYAWTYEDKPEDDIAGKEKGDAVLEILTENVMVTDFVPQYSNLAINMAYDDIAYDVVFMKAFLYIIIAILAFVVGITTATSLIKEANVIGTLRASGYTKREMLLHYMTVPVFVIFLGTVVGNILAYTVLKDYMAASYYGRFSFPIYKTLFNAEAFLYTSIIPTMIMIVIIAVILSKKLRLSPIRFLTRNLSTKRDKKVLPLHEKWNIFTKFRFRIILQNIPTYTLIFVGVFLANIIMMFGFLFGPMLENYGNIIVENKISEYQYILKAPVPTENEEAESYCATYLHDVNVELENEHVMMYGIEEESNYIQIESDQIYISDGYSEKYNIGVGDTIHLKEIYGTETYDLKVDGIYCYPSTISVFMNIDTYRELFDLEDSFFNGYFTDSELDDIDDVYIANVITAQDLTKVSDQLITSFGSMMNIFIVFGAIVFMLLIYLLSKIIIEKNSQNISLTKILGYRNSEINLIYVMANSIVTILSILITVPICNIIMGKICIVMFATYPQYFPYYMPETTFIKVIVMGIIVYAVVAFWQTKKAKKVPLDLALKNLE